MIRIWLLVVVVACSKAPRSTHEEAPATRPIDAAVAVVVDAAVVDQATLDASLVADKLDAGAKADAGVKTVKPDAGVKTDKPDAGVKPDKPDAGAPSSKPDAGTGAKLGKLGDVCAKGSRGNKDPEARPSTPVLECGPGLQCCYPCGIPGCDSVCKPTCPAVP